MLLNIDNINQILSVDPNILIRDMNLELLRGNLVFLPTANQLYSQLKLIDLFYLKLPNPSHHLYGSIFNFALGGSFETKFGKKIDLNKKVVKCASGYDFTRFLLGFKEFAKPTSLVLRLHPKRENKVFNFYLEISQLANLNSILEQLRIEPFALYLINKQNSSDNFYVTLIVRKEVSGEIESKLKVLNENNLENHKVVELSFPNDASLIKRIKFNKKDFVKEARCIKNILKNQNINCIEILFPLINLVCLVFKEFSDLEKFEKAFLAKFSDDQGFYSYDFNDKVNKIKANILKVIQKNDFKNTYINYINSSSASYPKFKKELERVASKKNITDDAEDLYLYSYDATFKSSLPEIVVFGESTQQISKVLSLASKYKIPVTCRGAGTNLSGGSVPLRGGVSLVLTQMNKVIELSEENRLAVVEPGVVTKELADFASKKGLFYPPDPASSAWCTIGGNVSECAGGPMCFKYGVTRDYVEFLEVVLSDGSVIRVDAFQHPEVIDLFIGSEGTLGIFTRIGLRLIKKPETRNLFLISFKDLKDAAACINDIISQGIMPKTFEIMDRSAIDLVKEYIFFDISFDTNALLILEIDSSVEEVESDVSVIKKYLNSKGFKFILAKDNFDMDKVWTLRKAISPACGKIAPTKISEDATVPRSKISDMIKGIKSIAKKYSLKIIIFGHAGDGNLHPNILTDKRNEDEMARVNEAIREIFELAISLGGTLSGEHGIGYMKAPYLGLEFDEETIKLGRAIKIALDPNNILNPDKIFV